jgi:hypothetical protein
MKKNRKTLTATFALSAVLAVSAFAQAQSSTGKQTGLTNPGFEEPRGKEASFAFAATMPGWKTTDKEFEIWSSGFEKVAAHEGTQFVELNAWIDGILYQDSTGIEAGSVLEFTFAHRGRSGEDTMKLTITDLGADNSLAGGDDTVLFTKEYSTGKDAWAVYDSTKEKQIKALGNTVRFAYGAIKSATGEIGAGNFLDAANFGIGVVTMKQLVPESDSVPLASNPMAVTPEVAIVKTELANGSFEEPRGIEKGFVFSNAMRGWKTTDTAFEIWSTGFEGFKAHDGTQFVELNAKLDGTLYQDLTGIGKGAVLDFSFAHRGRFGSDKMRLTITDLGSDNAIGGAADSVLFVKDYITGKDAWAAYNSTTVDPILARGNTLRFAFTAVHGTGDKGPDKTEGNFLDSVSFGVDVRKPDRSFTLAEAQKMLIGSWKADLKKTEARYGELNLRVRPVVVDGLFLTFSPNNSIEVVAGGVKTASQPCKIEGPTAGNDFKVATYNEEVKVTEVLRIIDNNLIVLKSGDGAMPLVFERHVGAISSGNNNPPANAMKLDIDGGAFTFGYRTKAQPGFTEFPNIDSPHPGIKRRNRKDGEYFSYAQNTRETEIKAQESSLVHYPAKAEGSGVLAPGQFPGDIAIARFTAMNDGEYKFNITAQLIEEDPTGAGVKIYVGDQVVDQKQLAGHLVPWSTSIQQKLKKGQTLDIAVDSGVDGNWEKDHVLLNAKAWTTK